MSRLSTFSLNSKEKRLLILCPIKHNCMCCKRAIPPFQWWISTIGKRLYIHVILQMIQCSQNLKGLIVVFKGVEFTLKTPLKKDFFILFLNANHIYLEINTMHSSWVRCFYHGIVLCDWLITIIYILNWHDHIVSLY